MEEAKAILSSLIPGNTSVWVFPSENPETHLDPDNFYGRVYMTALEGREAGGCHLAHLASYVRLTARHEWPGPQYHCGPASAQWDGLGGTVCPPLPYALQGALEGVSGFGKVKKETTQAVPESRQRGRIQTQP